MKKIIHINPQLEKIWWMERYIEQFYTSFSKDNKVYVLSFEKWEINLNIPIKNIFSLNEIVNNSIIAKIKKLFFRSKSIANFCKKNNIDISISHWDIWNIFNILSKFFWNKAKIIIIIHNAFDKKLLWSWLYYLCKFFYKYADEIISVSKELSKDLEKIIASNKIKTIYNPFDIEKINTLRNEILDQNIENILNNWKINILNLSRLVENKNQDLIITCFSEYYKKNTNIQLFFIWDWNNEYINKLKYEIKKLWLNKVIFFLWHKSNVYKYINKMNYMFYFSEHEWFPRVILDCFILWIPVLTNDFKYSAKEALRNNLDFSECIDIEIHENGILTPFRDKEKYIKWIELLLKSDFDKEKIIENTKKFDIINFINEWNLILK